MDVEEEEGDIQYSELELVLGQCGFAHLIPILEKANISNPWQLLLFTNLDLSKLTHMPSNDCINLLKNISKVLYPNLMATAATPLTLKNSESFGQNYKLSIGCSILDNFLRGGIPLVGITEIVGESACGKSNFCIQMALQVQLPRSLGGLGGTALYIDSEGDFPQKRFYQICGAIHRNLERNPQFNHLLKSQKEWAKSVIIESPKNEEELRYVLESKVINFITNHNVKLVILDSIAAIFRIEYEHSDFKSRTNSLLWHAGQLKLIADKYKVAVIVVNQVTDNVSNNSDLFYQGEDPYTISSPRLLPALGLIWSNCVNTRIVLSRTNSYVELETNQNIIQSQNTLIKTDNLSLTKTILRKIQIVLSPYLPNSTCNFIIDGEGVRGYQ